MVSVATMLDGDDLDDQPLVFDPVENAVLTAAR